MPTPTTTFRLTPRERARLDRLADKLVCSRTDVLRYGMAALRDDASGLVSQIRADNLALAFLNSLKSQYGEDAVIEPDDDPKNPHWRLAGKPLDGDTLSIVERHQGDRVVMDLVAKAIGVEIRNIQSWEEKDGSPAPVALRDLWVFSPTKVSSEPLTRQLSDGRTVVQFREDDGSFRQLAIDDEGNSSPFDPKEVPAAELSELRPSVGVGIRRESEHGPHIGTGYGEKWELTGNIEQDRSAVVSILEHLIVQAKKGNFDDILTKTPDSGDR